jgi:phage recombination protein Bet
MRSTLNFGGSDMTTALAVIEAPRVTNDQMELIRATVAKDATPDELKLYLYDCARIGVHPLDKLLHFTKRSGKYTPITSIDLMRIRAAETGELAGSDDAVFTGTPAQNGFEAHVTVYRLVQGQRCAFSATARWSEYKPDQAFMWNKMPHTMLGKCAEALALRKGFPRQLAGLYAKEEMDQAEKAERKPVVVPAPSSPAEQASEDWTAKHREALADALPLDQHIIKALKPGNGPAVGIAVTHRGEEFYIVKDDVLEIAKGLLESGTPMIGVTATKNKRTFVKEFMSPEAAAVKPQVVIDAAPLDTMMTADEIPF